MSENAWQFSEGGRVFGGPVDSAVVVSFIDKESLVIYGVSDDKNGTFFLTLSAISINAGSYNAENVSFSYVDSASGFFSNGTTNINVFIEKMDEQNVSGTFSGTMHDAENNVRTISEGKFHCTFRHQQNTPSAKTLTVWTKELCSVNNQIEIRIDNLSKYITSAFNSQPLCGADGAALFSLSAGEHLVEVVCGSDTIAYHARLNDECTFLEVELNQDYLPLKQSSSWEYANVHDQAVTQVFTAENTVDIDGKTYTKLVSTRGDIYYFRKLPHLYYQYRELSFQDFVGDAPFVELVILKDNLQKGDRWETEPLEVSISGVVQKIKMVSRIANRDYSDVINGVTYNNLIKVNTELFFSPDDGNSYATSGSAFNTVFARGLGIVDYNDMDITIEWGIKSISLSP